MTTNRVEEIREYIQGKHRLIEKNGMSSTLPTFAVEYFEQLFIAYDKLQADNDRLREKAMPFVDNRAYHLHSIRAGNHGVFTIDEECHRQLADAVKGESDG